MTVALKRAKTTAMKTQKRIEQFITKALEIQELSAEEADSLSFMAKILVQATLPHRNPGNVAAWGRQNGNFSLTIQPGIHWVEGQPRNIGLPYGSIPRLLMAWITTEATRTKERKIIFGDTLSEFMRELGLIPSGGRWGSITRMKEQMSRLFSARLVYQYDSHQCHAAKETPLTKERLLWWDEKQPSQGNLFKSYIVLDQDFFAEIVKNPVPLDMRALRELKQSPLALDLYTWLTYRMSYLKEETSIPWSALQVQFGSDYNRADNFRSKAKESIKKICHLYPELNIDEQRGRLVLQPSPTHVKKRPKILGQAWGQQKLSTNIW